MILGKHASKTYSQNGEDGIIKFLLLNLDQRTNRCLEIGTGDGTECNTALLVKDLGYEGVFIDKCENFNDHFYEGKKYKQIKHFVEPDNTQEIFKSLDERYDVFSIDIDGIDYWVLKEIIDRKLFSASIVVVEYQDIIGPEKSITVPYKKRFNGWDYDSYGGPNYCGASLMAFIGLLSQEYVFVGCEPLGFNAFFMNKDQSRHSYLKSDNIVECFKVEKVKWGMENRWPRVKDMKWEEV